MDNDSPLVCEVCRLHDRCKSYYEMNPDLEEGYCFLRDDSTKIVKQGTWIEVYRNRIASVYECNKCQHLTFDKSIFCPHCGALMNNG